MSKVLFSQHGVGARPYQGGTPAQSRLAPEGARLQPGAAEPYGFCAAMRKDGSACQAHPTKDSELCIGHQRAEAAKQ
jgi:hypothetical protein